MPDLTQCPECQRKLNVPDGQLGTLVRCPACGAEFTAEAYVPPRPESVAHDPEPPPREAPPPPRPPGPRDYPPPRYDEDYPPPPRRPPAYGGYDRGYGRPYYDGVVPHRAGSVQTLGILCLCFCWGGVICWVLGIITLVMASTDLGEMSRGRMDPSGRDQTKSGQVCAIIGLCISACLSFSCCGWWYFVVLASRGPYGY